MTPVSNFNKKKRKFELKDDGTVKAFGRNTNGQLGLGDLTSRSTPTLLPNINNVKNIYVGYFSSILVLSKEFFNFLFYLLQKININFFHLDNGTVFVFGDNGNGQLGLGNNVSALIPTLNPYLNGTIIEKISSSYHTLILLSKKYKINLKKYFF